MNFSGSNGNLSKFVDCFECGKHSRTQNVAIDLEPLNYAYRMATSEVNTATTAITSPKEENNDEVSKLKEILKEVTVWAKKEHELDEEIRILRDSLNKEPVVTDKDIMEELHKYNDMKDAAQVVIGSLARFEGVSVTELHKRYNLEMSDA